MHGIQLENWCDPENEGKCKRKRNGRGGGYEFTPCALPALVQAALVARIQEPVEAEGEQDQRARHELWRAFDRLLEQKKERARKAHRVLMMVEEWVCAKHQQKKLAIAHIAKAESVGKTTIYNWYHNVRGLNWMCHGLVPDL